MLNTINVDKIESISSFTSIETTMVFVCSWLNSLLAASMAVTLLFGVSLMSMGLILTFCLEILVEEYLDSVLKSVNFTKLLINKHESIVPTKDNLPSYLYVGDWALLLAGTSAAVGLVMVTYSVFGCMAARYKRPLPLLILSIILVVSVTVQIILLGNVMYLNSSLHIKLREILIDTLLTNYEAGAKTDNVFTFFLNSIMLMAQCCGVDGPGDFEMMNLTFTYNGTENGTVSVPLSYPPACCKEEFIDAGFEATLMCATSRLPWHANRKGCYTTIFDTMMGGISDNIILIANIIAGFEILQAVITIGLLFKPKPEENSAKRQALAAARNFVCYTHNVPLHPRCATLITASDYGSSASDQPNAPNPFARRQQYSIFVPHALQTGEVVTEIW